MESRARVGWAGGCAVFYSKFPALLQTDWRGEVSSLRPLAYIVPPFPATVGQVPACAQEPGGTFFLLSRAGAQVSWSVGGDTRRPAASAVLSSCFSLGPRINRPPTPQLPALLSQGALALGH